MNDLILILGILLVKIPLIKKISINSFHQKLIFVDQKNFWIKIGLSFFYLLSIVGLKMGTIPSHLIIYCVFSVHSLSD